MNKKGSVLLIIGIVVILIIIAFLFNISCMTSAGMVYYVERNADCESIKTVGVDSSIWANDDNILRQYDSFIDKGGKITKIRDDGYEYNVDLQKCHAWFSINECWTLKGEVSESKELTKFSFDTMSSCTTMYSSESWGDKWDFCFPCKTTYKNEIYFECGDW